jgi:hypothetical protein
MEPIPLMAFQKAFPSEEIQNELTENDLIIAFSTAEMEKKASSWDGLLAALLQGNCKNAADVRVWVASASDATLDAVGRKIRNAQRQQRQPTY